MPRTVFGLGAVVPSASARRLSGPFRKGLAPLTGVWGTKCHDWQEVYAGMTGPVHWGLHTNQASVCGRVLASMAAEHTAGAQRLPVAGVVHTDMRSRRPSLVEHSYRLLRPLNCCPGYRCTICATGAGQPGSVAAEHRPGLATCLRHSLHITFRLGAPALPIAPRSLKPSPRSTIRPSKTAHPAARPTLPAWARSFASAPVPGSGRRFRPRPTPASDPPNTSVRQGRTGTHS